MRTWDLPVYSALPTALSSPYVSLFCQYLGFGDTSQKPVNFSLFKPKLYPNSVPFSRSKSLFLFIVYNGSKQCWELVKQHWMTNCLDSSMLVIICFQYLIKYMKFWRTMCPIVTRSLELSTCLLVAFPSLPERWADDRKLCKTIGKWHAKYF